MPPERLAPEDEPLLLVEDDEEALVPLADCPEEVPRVDVLRVPEEPEEEKPEAEDETPEADPLEVLPMPPELTLPPPLMEERVSVVL